MVPEHLSLLAVDDDPGDLELLGRTLEEIEAWEIAYHPVSDPTALVSSLAAVDPGVVLLDQQLGSTTGLDLCRQVRRNGYDRPVIMLTGQGDERLAVEALHAGVSDYLPKDRLDVHRLQSAIEEALERDHLQRQVEAYKSHLEETNESLRQRTAEVESYYHVLSHELKNPLTVVREFLGIVLDRIPGPLNADQTEYLQIALENCDRMVRQVGDLVDSARLETGKLEVRLRPVDPGALLRKVITAARPEVTRAGLSLAQRVPERLPEVLGDADRIAQIVMNLVHNAVKFTPPGGRIEIGAGPSVPPTRSVRVWVNDSGVGIASSECARIFERLYQAQDRASSRSGGGSPRPDADPGLGLGLSICRQLVQLHGGEIGVQSREGEGSTFFFTLPEAQASEEDRRDGTSR